VPNLFDTPVWEAYSKSGADRVHVQPQNTGPCGCCVAEGDAFA
jgi:hypothetical protein